jgi:hypothetical protein
MCRCMYEVTHGNPSLHSTRGPRSGYWVNTRPLINKWFYCYSPMNSRDLDTALLVFRDQGGTLRTRDVTALGVHTDALYALRDGGQTIELGRALYRLNDSM